MKYIQEYIDQFNALKTDTGKGKQALHKAVLLLSVIDLIESKTITTNVVKCTQVKNKFRDNWEKLIGNKYPNLKCSCSYPFIGLNSESFWTLQNNCQEALLNPFLFIYLRDNKTLKLLREVLMKKYLYEITQSITTHKVDFTRLDTSVDRSLRPYQMYNKGKIYQFWHKGRSVMLQMPTGTGKTRLFSSIVKDLHNWGMTNKKAVKILLLAHRKELIDQISRNIGINYNLAHGLIISNNIEQKEYPIQVGSVPTLHRRIDKWSEKDFDIIIVDEAHHITADSYKKILKEYPNAKILGVTATPYRLNGAGFKDVFEELIISDPVAKFIKDGFLSEYDYFSISPLSKTQRSIENISNFALDGDYLDSAMIEIVDTDRVRAGIVKTYIKFAANKKGIIYTINKDHNEHVCKQFNESGISAKAIDSDTDPKTRISIIDDFKMGKFKVLCNVNIFSEGFDCPDVEFVQLARPTKSLSMFLQQIGRGFRISSEKEKVIFLDNVGLYNRFGLPSARRMWRKHFEGNEITDAELRGDPDTEGRKVCFFNEYDEGDEAINLIHSSKLETEIEFENKSKNQNIFSDMKNYEKDFCSYMSKMGYASGTINVYSITITKHIDNDIKEKIDSSHNSLFYIIDVELIELLKVELEKSYKSFETNKFKNNRCSVAIKKYLNFAKSYNNTEECSNTIQLSNQNPQETIDDVNADINTFKKYGKDIPKELLEKKRRLENAKILSDMPKEIINRLDGVFSDIDFDISINLHYSTTSGLKVNMTGEESTPNDESVNSSSGRDKLRITFADGSVIQRTKVKETLVEVVKKIGVSKIEKLNIIWCGFPLIDRSIHKNINYAKSQVEVENGIFLNTNSCTMKKKEQIEEISQRLGLNIKVDVI